MRSFVLDRLYPRALDGLPGLGTPAEFADGFRNGAGTLRERAEALTRRHVALSGAAGFLSGLGGFLLMPVTLPTNIAAVALVQLHMAASLAALAGEDPADPAVRERVLACLIGEAPPETAKTTGEETLDRFGLKLAERGLNALVTAGVGIVGWATRQVATGYVKRRFLRGIPLVGGVIGAVSDGYVTNNVATAALDRFLPVADDDDDDRGGPGGDGTPGGDGLPEGVVHHPGVSSAP
ncbi:MAG TPA: EcsC family protein [Rhodothermales bacterium]|nr:EcsC family protein [Rhodothermales bacterium]